MNGADRSADALLRAIAARAAAADRIAPTVADTLLTAVAGTAAMVLDARAVSIATYVPSTDRLVYVAAAGPAAGEVVGQSIDAASGIAGYAFATGQPLAVADVAADPRFDRSVAEATGYVPSSLLATPLIDSSGAVGVLEVLDVPSDAFSLHDLHVAAAFAQLATRIVRGGSAERDAHGLLRRAVEGWLALDGDPPDAAGIDAIVGRAVADLAIDDDDPTWRLADRLTRLREVDPELTELAIDWLDAILRRHDPARRTWRSSEPR